MNDSAGAEHVPGKLAAAGRAALRWFWSVLYVVGTVAAALVLADSLQNLVEPAMTREGLELPSLLGLSARRVAIAGLSIGLMLSSVSRLWNVLIPLYRYARRGHDFDFLKNLMAIFAPCFLLMFAYYSVQRGSDPVPVDAPVNNWSVRLVAPFRPSAERHAVFPLYFEPGRLTDDRISHGFELSEAHEKAIDDLITAFGPCAAPGTPVSLRVFGYASSKAFAGYEASVYAELNRERNTELANLRAKSVHDYIVGKLPSGVAEAPFEVQLIRHESYDDMVRSRAFDDRPLGEAAESESELFTRSAHIRIDSAGRCEYSEADFESGQR